MAKLYDRTVAELMIEAAREAQYPTQRGDLVAWFEEHYPLVKASTVRAHITGLTANDRNRHHYRWLVEREPLFTRDPDGSLSAHEGPEVGDVEEIEDAEEGDARHSSSPWSPSSRVSC
jgi:hypothetical protein